MIKFTQFDGDQQIVNSIIPTISNGIPKTITFDNLINPLEDEDEEIVQVSMPADDNDSEYDNHIQPGTSMGVAEPPKPPPRSTSIYHLQRLQQQALQDNSEFILNQPLNSIHRQSQSAVFPSFLMPNVVMRDKIKKADDNNQFKLPAERPKSNIYEVRNFLNNHIITGTNGSNKTPRPMSMYVDSSAEGESLGSTVSRPIRSRFSAYEISVIFNSIK